MVKPSVPQLTLTEALCDPKRLFDLAAEYDEVAIVDDEDGHCQYVLYAPEKIDGVDQECDKHLQKHWQAYRTLSDTEFDG